MLAQKAKSYFNYLNMLEKGAGMYQAPKTELLLLDDEDEIVSKAFDDYEGQQTHLTILSRV